MLLPGLTLKAKMGGGVLRRKLFWSWRCYIGDKAQRTEPWLNLDHVHTGDNLVACGQEYQG